MRILYSLIATSSSDIVWRQLVPLLHIHTFIRTYIFNKQSWLVSTNFGEGWVQKLRSPNLSNICYHLNHVKNKMIPSLTWPLVIITTSKSFDQLLDSALRRFAWSPVKWVSICSHLKYILPVIMHYFIASMFGECVLKFLVHRAQYVAWLQVATEWNFRNSWSEGLERKTVVLLNGFQIYQ